MAEQVYREKSLEKISSPDQLDDYLKVSTPGLWVILIAVVALLAGILVWANMAHLETKIETLGTVENQMLEAPLTGSDAEKVKTGMVVRVGSHETKIDLLKYDDYGRTIAIASTDLPDGNYKAEIIIESINPIHFLSR